MALIGLRGGGEHGNTVGWASIALGTISVHTSNNLTGMGGPASIKYDSGVSGNSRFVWAGGTSEHATVYFSFKFMADSIAAPSAQYTTRYVLTNNGSLNVGGFRLAHNATGLFTLQPLNADLSNAGAAVTGNHFVAGQTHVISCKFVAGATGSFELNIDGVNVIPTTTINTTSAHPAGTAGGFVVSTVTTSSPNRLFYMGDWIFDDAAYPPANATVIGRQFKAGTPSSDAFATVGGGTKYGNISQSPPSTTLAIASASTTAAAAQEALINSFSATETGKGTGTIGGSDTLLGVQAQAWAKTSATSSGGGAASIRIRLGGVATDDALTLTTGDLFYRGSVKTGVSLANLNAGEAGWVKAVTAAARVQTVEDMWVVAAYVPVTITHYTIAADAGSYALTGTAAGLRATRKVAADPGSYALVGSAATLDAPWTPAALGAALLGWWDADDFASFTLEDSNTRVTQWRDAVGSYGPDQGSGFAARPIYNPTGFGGRPCVEFDGVNHHLSLASVPFPTGSSPSEIWALVDQTAPAATDTINRVAFSYGGSGTTTRRVVRIESAGVNRARASVGTGAATVNATDATVVLTGQHVLRGQFSATTTSVAIDGSALTSAAAVPATATLRTRIGSSDGDPSGQRWLGSIAAIIVTDLLTTEQADELNSWLSARIGAAAYSLDAEAGSYALTGAAAGLKKSYAPLAAAAGSYALTGAAATLRRSYVPFPALSGAYAVTGSAAGLKAGRKFAAAASSYALTGSIAGLKPGRKVAAPAGAYSLTGVSAGLLTTRRLSASAGSYLLTGTPAGLIYSVADPVLTVEPGAYALIGTAAGLRAVHKLVATAGSYALTGTAAGLVRAEPHRVLAAEAGSYLIGGQPVSFVYTPVAPPIPVDPGGGGGGGGFDWPSETKKRSKKRLSEYLARAEAELLYGKSQPKKKSRRVDLKRLQEIASEVPPERLAAAREIILEAREDWRLAREAATLALLDRIAAFYAAVAERQRLALLEAAILQARRDEIAEAERRLAVLAALEYQRLMDEEAAVVAVLMAA